MSTKSGVFIMGIVRRVEQLSFRVFQQPHCPGTNAFFILVFEHVVLILRDVHRSTLKRLALKHDRAGSFSLTCSRGTSCSYHSDDIR